MKSFYITLLIILLSVSIEAIKIKHRNYLKARHHNKLRFKQEEAPAIIHEGWLRISSENLIDAERYPAIPHKKDDKPSTPV
jgi:hypothetical protein